MMFESKAIKMCKQILSHFGTKQNSAQTQKQTEKFCKIDILQNNFFKLRLSLL